MIVPWVLMAKGPPAKPIPAAFVPPQTTLTPCLTISSKFVPVTSNAKC